MMHKIRLAMGKRDDRYKLEGMVVMDEGFFKVAEFEVGKEDEDDGDKPSKKRGRGSLGNAKFVVMASVMPSKKKKKKGRPATILKYVKMLLVDDLKANTMEETVKETFDKQPVLPQMASDAIITSKTY